MPELVCSCYNQETYSKVIEFLDFSDRLSSSIQRTIAEIEMRHCLLEAELLRVRTTDQLRDRISKVEDLVVTGLLQGGRID